jgi:hypothetical protein
VWSRPGDRLSIFFLCVTAKKALRNDDAHFSQEVLQLVSFATVIQANQGSGDLGELLQNYTCCVLQASSLNNSHRSKIKTCQYLEEFVQMYL